MDVKRKDREFKEKVMQENALAVAAEEDKNNKFSEKMKTISKFVQEQISVKSENKPKAMNNNEEKINQDIIGKLEFVVGCA
jgi:hypothetical protein